MFRPIILGLVYCLFACTLHAQEKLSMKYTTVIFDLDGTILNTEPLWREATRLMLAKRNVQVTPQDQDQIDQRVRGLPLKECCTIIKEMHQLTDPVELIMQDEIDLVSVLYDTHLTFVPGFENCHARIEKVGMKTAIASNCTDSVIFKAARSLNLEQFFGSHIYGISHVNNIAKPQPDIFLHAARMLASEPEECIVIEDSRSGIQAAKAAGMKCIAINTGHMQHLLTQADVIVQTFDELAELF